MSLPNLRIKRKKKRIKGRDDSLTLKDVLKHYKKYETSNVLDNDVFYTTPGSKLLSKHFGPKNEKEIEHKAVKEMSKITGISSFILESEFNTSRKQFNSQRASMFRSARGKNKSKSFQNSYYHNPETHHDLLAHINQARQDQKFNKLDSIAPLHDLFSLNQREKSSHLTLTGSSSSKKTKKKIFSDYGFDDLKEVEQESKLLTKLIYEKVSMKHKKGYDLYKGIYRIKVNLKNEIMTIKPTTGTGTERTISFDDVLKQFLASWKTFIGLEKNLKALGYYFKGIMGLRGIKDKDDYLATGIVEDFEEEEEEIDSKVHHRKRERESRKKLLKEKILQLKMQRDQKLGILSEENQPGMTLEELKRNYEEGFGKKDTNTLKGVVEKTQTIICRLLLDNKGKARADIDLDYLRKEALYQRKYHDSAIFTEVENLRKQLHEKFEESCLNPYENSTHIWSRKSFQKMKTFGLGNQFSKYVKESSLPTEESGQRSLRSQRVMTLNTPKNKKRKLKNPPNSERKRHTLMHHPSTMMINSIKKSFEDRQNKHGIAHIPELKKNPIVSSRSIRSSKKTSHRNSPSTKSRFWGQKLFKKSITYSKKSKFTKKRQLKSNQISVTSALFPNVKITLRLLNNKKQLLMDEFNSTIVLKTLFFLKDDLDKFILRRKKEHYKSLKKMLRESVVSVDEKLLDVNFYDKHIKLKRINKDNKFKQILHLGDKDVVNSVAVVNDAMKLQEGSIIAKYNEFEKYNGKLGKIGHKNIGISKYINGILFGAGK